jgi:hypothetical protein
MTEVSDGWAYTPIELNPRNPEAKAALMLQPPGAARCVQAKHFPSGHVVYGYGATEGEAREDAERQGKDWDERGS